MLNHPRVGVAVVIKKRNKILLGKRTGSHGAGTWNCPGGHLEYGESFEDCARREIKEEAGLLVKNLQFFHVTNDIFTQEKKHYITIFMTADYIDGTPKIMEPDKCDAWEWFSTGDMPSPLFLPLENVMREKKGF